MRAAHFALLVSILIIGCARSGRHDGRGLDRWGRSRWLRGTGTAVVMKSLELSAERPSRPDLGIQLVAVEPDGTVVITHAGQERRAMPGQAFGEGLFAPRVQSSDPRAGGAVLTYMTCERF